MVKKISKSVRDFFMFMSLIGLINIALKRTYHFISAHEKSVIHELDYTFLDQLYTAKKQTHIALQLIKQLTTELTEQCELNDPVCILKIEKLQKKIDALEEEYKKNSPGLAFLGPIGTTSIIFKEKRVSKELLKIVNKITKRLLPLIEEKSNFVPSTTITQALQTNKKLIAKIQTYNV